MYVWFQAILGITRRDAVAAEEFAVHDVLLVHRERGEG